MAHTEPRSTPLREGAIAVVTGGVYGVVHTLSGHPLDNLKARLQLDTAYHNVGAIAAVRKMYANEGIHAFFRGCIPPLWGSAVYRSIMMSSCASPAYITPRPALVRASERISGCCTAQGVSQCFSPAQV